MLCRNCGKEFESKFCPECGTPLLKSECKNIQMQSGQIRQREWYTKTWAIIVFLVLSFPVGLVFMWKSNWNKTLKVIISVFVGVLVAIVGFGKDSANGYSNMQSLMGLMVFASMVAFALLIIMLPINAIRKKPIKPILKLLVCCFGVFVFSMVIGNYLYTPEQQSAFAEERVLQQAKKEQNAKIAQVEKEAAEAQKQADKAEKERKKSEQAEKKRLEKEQKAKDEQAKKTAESEAVQKEQNRIEEEAKKAEKSRLEKETSEKKAAEEKIAAEEKLQEEKENEILNTSFADIYDAYKNNEIAADDKYKGNRYKITCEIYAIGDGGLNGLLGDISVSASINYNGKQCILWCSFDEKTQREALSKISMGDTITFIGTCYSWGSWSDCELQ